MATLTLVHTEQNAHRGMPSIAQVLALHLMPGVLITLGFVLLASTAAQLGLPSVLALLLTWLIVGIPIELGYLLVQGKKQNGRLSLAGVVLNREPLPLRQYLWLVPALLVWTMLCNVAFVPLTEALQRTLFTGLPEWFYLSTFAQSLNRYSQPALWATVVLSFVLNIVVPIVEEIYFRGYLLPRLSHLGRWAPALNVLLFSLYHFWSPWDNPMRIVALLPVVYVVWRKRNVYLGIWVHVLLNSIGSAGLLALVLSQA